MYYVSVGATACVGLGQVASGIVLVWSINKVRNFLKKSESSEQLNLRTMLFHSLAFIPHLLLVVAYYATQLMYFFVTVSSSDSDKQAFFEKLSFDTVIASIFVQFIVSCLLCAIFWQLSNEDETEEQEEEDEEEDPGMRLTAIEIEAFDQETELQAKMWNQFMRDREDSEYRKNKVTPSMIVSHNPFAMSTREERLVTQAQKRRISIAVDKPHFGASINTAGPQFGVNLD